jgi:hypothetical protein
MNYFSCYYKLLLNEEYAWCHIFTKMHLPNKEIAKMHLSKYIEKITDIKINFSLEV